MRGALLGVMLGVVACAQVGSSATQPATARPDASAPAAKPDPRWWCLSFPNGAVGRCHSMQLACVAARGYMLATRDSPTEQLSDCIPQENVVCFDARNVRSGHTEMICHPTFATCRSHIDHFQGEDGAADKRVISPCRAMSAVPGRTVSTAIAGEEAAHWWCMSFNGDSMGECDRSRALCEDGRGFVQREFAGAQLSECVAQRTAMCFEVESADGSTHRKMCQPSSSICQSTLEYYKKRLSTEMRVVSDCRTVE